MCHLSLPARRSERQRNKCCCDGEQRTATVGYFLIRKDQDAGGGPWRWEYLQRCHAGQCGVPTGLPDNHPHLAQNSQTPLFRSSGKTAFHLSEETRKDSSIQRQQTVGVRARQPDKGMDARGKSSPASAESIDHQKSAIRSWPQGPSLWDWS